MDVSALDVSALDVSALDVSAPVVSALDVSALDGSALDVSPDRSALDVSSVVVGSPLVLSSVVPDPSIGYPLPLNAQAVRTRTGRERRGIGARYNAKRAPTTPGVCPRKARYSANEKRRSAFSSCAHVRRVYGLVAMTKTRGTMWKVDQPQVENVLKRKRDPLIDAADHKAKFGPVTTADFDGLVERHFPLEPELLRLVKRRSDDTSGNDKFIWEVLEFAGDAEILQHGMLNQDFLDLDSNAKTLKFKVNLPLNKELVAKYIQNVKDYFEEFNDVIRTYHSTETERLRKRVVTVEDIAAQRKAAIQELSDIQI